LIYVRDLKNVSAFFGKWAVKRTPHRGFLVWKKGLAPGGGGRDGFLLEVGLKERIAPCCWSRKEVLLPFKEKGEVSKKKEGVFLLQR